MSNKSRSRGQPRDHWDHVDPRPGMFYDPGRDGSPYTFEGQMGRLRNEIGSLTSPDPKFRKKAQFRYLVVSIPTVIVPAIIWIVVLVRQALH